MARKALVRIIIFCVGTMLLVATAKSGENPPFTAVCEDIVTHGYRDSTDLSGEPMDDSWSTDEQFYSTWSFRYDGGREIVIDGKPGYVLAEHPGILIVLEDPLSGRVAAGVWTYAIHIGMGTVVGSQVHAHGGFDEKYRGVKARSTEFRCQFDTD